MTIPVMTAADFEARYAAIPDPWGYESSTYEHDKYTETLLACGDGPIGRALELGGSIGAFSARLAPRCAALVTVDAAPTAVLAARGRLGEFPHVDVRLGVLPGDVPDGPFDLIVASEILYYLAPADLEPAIERLTAQLAPGGRLVAVHWRPRTPERALDAEEVHAALARAGGLERAERHVHPSYFLERFRCR